MPAPDGASWRRCVLGVAAVGLPVNDLADYALLMILAVVIFSGEVSAQAARWLAAAGDRRRGDRRAVAAGAAAHR